KAGVARSSRAGEAMPLELSESEDVPGTDEVVGATPTEGPIVEVIRLDEEPVSKTGRGPRGPWAFESPRFRYPRRGSPTVTTPGPQPGGRGSTPRRGTQMPGSRAVRRPAVTRKAGVRAPPWQPRAR